MVGPSVDGVVLLAGSVPSRGEDLVEQTATRLGVELPVLLVRAVGSVAGDPVLQTDGGWWTLDVDRAPSARDLGAVLRALRLLGVRRPVHAIVHAAFAPWVDALGPAKMVVAVDSLDTNDLVIDRLITGGVRTARLDELLELSASTEPELKIDPSFRDLLGSAVAAEFDRDIDTVVAAYREAVTGGGEFAWLADDGLVRAERAVARRHRWTGHLGEMVRTSVDRDRVRQVLVRYPVSDTLSRSPRLLRIARRVARWIRL